MRKTPRNTETEKENFLALVKSIYWNPYRERPNASQDNRVTPGRPFSPLDSTQCWGLRPVPKQEKEMKGSQIRKERIKMVLFVNDMIVYIENPRESKKNKQANKLLELAIEF